VGNADLRFVILRRKSFPQRTCAAPNYRVARFQKSVGMPVWTGRLLALNLKSKLLRARSAIFSS
jgi:hypothetical protein